MASKNLPVVFKPTVHCPAKLGYHAERAKDMAKKTVALLAKVIR